MSIDQKPLCIIFPGAVAFPAAAAKAAALTRSRHKLLLRAKQYFSITKQWTRCITWLQCLLCLQAIPVATSPSDFSFLRTSSTFYLWRWLSLKTFAFSLLLGFLCCRVAVQLATPIPPSYLQLSPQLFVAYFQGGQVIAGGGDCGKFAFAYCPAQKTLAVCCQIECDSLRSVLVKRRRKRSSPWRCKL